MGPMCRWLLTPVVVLRRVVVVWFLQGVKKPFNPIIGETFACAWRHEDGSFSQYLAEQVGAPAPAFPWPPSPLDAAVLNVDLAPCIVVHLCCMRPGYQLGGA